MRATSSRIDLGTGGGDEAGTGAQGGEAHHGGGAGFAVGSADQENVAELALVAIDAARPFGDGLGGTSPVQFCCTLERGCGGADAGDDHGAEEQTGGEVAEDVRRLGGGEGHDGIGAEGLDLGIFPGCGVAVGVKGGGVGVPAAG